MPSAVSAGTLAVRVWRGGAEGEFRTYEVPRREHQTVLDVVAWIQRRLDASLAYRYACRVGMCGSCAMTVEGVARWTCRTHVARVARGGRLTIAPLENFPIVRDLVVDMSPFFEKWQRARGRFAGTRTRADSVAAVPPASPARRAADAAIECIGCGICYASCEVVARRREYLGPAALTRAWTLVCDERDAERAERLAAVATDAGAFGCHTQMGCTERCPKHLSPTAAIAGLKREATRALFGGRL